MSFCGETPMKTAPRTRDRSSLGYRIKGHYHRPDKISSTAINGVKRWDSGLYKDGRSFEPGIYHKSEVFPVVPTDLEDQPNYLKFNRFSLKLKPNR